MTAPSPVCQVDGHLPSKKSVACSLVIEGLSMTADEVEFDAKLLCRLRDRVGVKLSQQKIQPSQIGNVRASSAFIIARTRRANVGRDKEILDAPRSEVWSGCSRPLGRFLNAERELDFSTEAHHGDIDPVCGGAAHDTSDYHCVIGFMLSPRVSVVRAKGCQA